MRIAVLGGGVMGETVASGLLERMPDRPSVVVVEKRRERAEELQATLGVDIADAATAVRTADVVVLVVKPQDLLALLDEVGSAINPDALVLSIAAGITTAAIEARVPSTVQVVRAMPNTPARIGKGATGLSAGSSCSREGMDLAHMLMETVGMVVEVPETLQDAVTAVSGSGPAYLFYLAEAMQGAAEELGLDSDTARDLVVATLDGAASLLADSDESARELRAKVTSPNGTTAAATASFDASGLPAVIAAGMTAARDRGRELSGS